MLDALHSAISGIQVGLAGLDAAAHGLANLGTEGFRRQEVRSVERPEGGARPVVVEGVDDGPAADIVQALLARHTVSLNAAVARRADAAAGELVDLLG